MSSAAGSAPSCQEAEPQTIPDKEPVRTDGSGFEPALLREYTDVPLPELLL